MNSPVVVMVIDRTVVTDVRQVGLADRRGGAVGGGRGQSWVGQARRHAVREPRDLGVSVCNTNTTNSYCTTCIQGLCIGTN